MQQNNANLNIDTLIQIVKKGGKVRTGVDVYSKIGVLLLGKDVLVEIEKPLVIIKKSGLIDIPVDSGASGGIWDSGGNEIKIEAGETKTNQDLHIRGAKELEHRITRIFDLKKEAAQKYKKAKENIQKVISDIRKTGGEFDYKTVETTVTDLVGFITLNDNAFSLLTKEILSYDDYLYHHSINVCTIGTAILKKFNEQFGSEAGRLSRHKMFQISIGLFLHDVGKILIPEPLLNKAGRLTPEEFALVKTHSYEKGIAILDKNAIHSSTIRDIVQFHHGAIQKDESNCYPRITSPENLPIYLKVCKLADIYDAMTSKRSYKDALNPVAVVTEIVRKYAQKDQILRHLLHSFIKSIGIYPAGSVVQLRNGQLGYVLDSQGPLIVPFTDSGRTPIAGILVPIDMADEAVKNSESAIDVTKALLSPIDTFHLLPDHLKHLTPE
ncbi:MAG: HD domain-containing phosphohydrolase [Pseudomonadota bacterium]